MKYLSTLLAIFICLGTAFSQEKGLINITLPHLDEDRPVTLYVPTDYDSTKAYDLMVMLHGLGASAENMAKLAQSMAESDETYRNYIYIAPDGGSEQIKDFYTPREDITIVDKCIEFAKNSYNVDTNRVFLQGFSLGARSAMCYGLAHPEKFHALILNTPAVQGPKDAMNIIADLDLMERIRYENAREIPMMITNGGKDIFYLESIQMAVDSLYKYNGKVLHAVYPDIEHQIPVSSFQIAQNAFNGDWLGNDQINLMEIIAPDNTLDVDQLFKLKFRNIGDNNITKFDIKINNGELEKEQTIECDLEPFEIDSVVIEVGALNSGINDISCQAQAVNEIPITDTPEAKHSIFYTETPHQLPYLFSPAPDNELEEEWFIEESPQLETWQPYQDGAEYAVAYYSNPTLMTFNYTGFKDALVSPFFDLSSSESPELSFDLAYNYFYYQIQGTEYIYSDTLVVEISTDEGKTFEEIFRKTKDELTTYDEPFKDIFEQSFIYNVRPSAENWRKEKIDLENYADAKHAQFKISVICAMGGLTILDNIKLDTKTSVPEKSNSSISLYPNPSSDYINVSGDEIHTYKIVDMLGNDLTKMVSRSRNMLNISALASGSYTLVINGKANNFVVSK